MEHAVTKILLVEDNEMNRDMLSQRLERRSYEVVMAVDGADGVARAKAERPDLILMDMSLPVIASIPVTALTAHAMDGDRDRALEAGRNDLKGFEKPVRVWSARWA
jgi:CheY-like chemotaxis protein